MTVYLLQIPANTHDWGRAPITVGVFSTREGAEVAYTERYSKESSYFEIEEFTLEA